jgi:rod shape-determining protein MreD
MRRAVMSAVLLAVAILVQLTIINGLRLPGGGVPDLVLVVVAALALAGGPVPGAVAGFCAGLCLDLAPPASGVIGEYALVFVIVGWACGRLRGTLARSAVLPIVIVAAAAAAGEVLVAGLGLALGSAQASWDSIRQLLLSAVSYDVAISPFVLYGVLLAGAWLADAIQGRPAPGPGPAAARAGAYGAASYGTGSYGTGAAGTAALAGRRGLAGAGTGSAPAGAVLLGLGGWLAGPPRSRRARRALARRSPRLRPGAGHAGDGWIGSSLAARGGQSGQAPGRRAARLGGSAFRGQVLTGPFLSGPGLVGGMGGMIPTGEPLRGQAFRGRVVSGLPGSTRRSGGGAARLRSGVAGSAYSGRRGALGSGGTVGLGGPALRGSAGTDGSALRGSALRGSAFRGSTLGGSALRGSVLRGSALRGSALRGSALRGSALRGSALRGSALRGSALRGSALRRGGPRGSAFRGGAPHAGGPRAGARRGGSPRSGAFGTGPRSARLLSRLTGGRLLRGHGPVRPGRALSHGAMAHLGRRRPRRSGGFRPSGAAGGSALRRPAGGTGLGPAAPLRIGAHSRSRDGVIGGGALTRPGPAAARAAAPRFRIRPGSAAGHTGHAGHTGRRPATPRFRTRPLAGPRAGAGKLPRFGYRRWRVLTILIRRRGGRRQVWRINSRWTGGDS